MSATMSRKTASLISTIMGLINSAISIFLTFLIRTVVLKEFGVEYVGLYSLLSQTIGILAGVDGGISSALFIRMHKPIASNNIDEIQNSYYLIRVVYSVRGILVFTIGTIVAFFLPIIANTSIDLTVVYCCYFAFLVLNAISYFFIYDFFMLETIQKRYIASAVVCVVNIFITAINLVCVYKYHSYLTYIIITSLNQVIAYSICRIIFRSIKKDYYKRLRFKKGYFKEILSLLGMSLHTFSNILITNSDTIMMSALLSLAVTGFYANYHLILTGVTTFATQLTLSIKDPFRNLALTSSEENSFINIKRIVLLYSVVIGAMGITFSAMADFFVGIFWGMENIINSSFTVYLLAISFYINILSGPIVDYYYCKEYYRKDKISPIIEIFLNIATSILLARIIGLNGIIVGTILTYLYRFIHRSRIVYGSFCNSAFVEIFSFVLKSLLIYVVLSLGFRFFISTLGTNRNIYTFIVFAIMIFCLSLFIMYCLFKKQKEMRYFESYFTHLSKKILEKIRNH